MFGNTPVSAVLGAVPPGHLTDEKKARAYLKSLTSAGLAPVLIYPAGDNEKRVADMRTDREKARDTEAHGQPVGGVLTASTDLTTLMKYVRRYFKAPDARRQKGTPAGFGDVALNLGLNLGASNLVVVDADYPAEVAAFVTWYAKTFAVDVAEVPGPTVKSPGTLNADGTRNHRDGGHWYFSVPRELVDLSTSPTSGRDIVVDADEVAAATGQRFDRGAEGRTKFTIKTGNSYVLIPPSVRTAGPYTLNMPDPDVDPLALLDALGATLDDEGSFVVEATVASGPNYSDEIPVTDLTPHVEELQRTAADLAEQSPVPPLTPDVADRALSLFGAIGAPAAPAAAEDAVEPEPVPTFGEVATLDDRLAEWWETTSWGEVLEGWSVGGRDECGCDFYTRPHAPGESVTRKSLTAHDAGCSRPRTDPRHPAGHVWSDHVDDDLLDMTQRFGRTLSAFAIFTALHYAGDFAAACKAVGIPSGYAQDLSGLGTDFDDVPLVEATADAVETARREDDTPYLTDNFTPPVPRLREPGEVRDAAGRDMFEAWQVERPEGGMLPGTWSPFGTLDDFRNVEPPGWIVEDMLQLQGLLSVLGDSGSGKSAVIIDLLCTIASGAGSWFGRRCASFPVVYVAGEGFEGAVARMRSWERVNGCTVGDRMFIVPQPVPLSDTSGAWAWIAYNARAVGAGLVVVDTLARSAVGLDENSASDMGEAITVLDKVRRTTGAAVMLVHHTARGTDRARGSNSLRGAVDSELLVTPFGDAEKVTTSTGESLPPNAHPVTVSVSKQKNGRDDVTLSLALVDEVDARRIDGADVGEDAVGVVVTDRDLQPALTRQTFGHTVAATFDPIPLPKPIDIVDEVTEYLKKYDTLTRSLGQIHAGVKQPPGVNAPARAWNEVVDLAVDLAVSRGDVYKKGAQFVHKSAADPDMF